MRLPTDVSSEAEPARDLPRRSAISWARSLNTSLDTVFYDVGKLSPQERAELSAYTIPEGAVLVVYPGAFQQVIRCLTPADFVQQHGGENGEAVDAVVVAGVGSSAIGTAALARNVADHLGRPVAGIVSGFGMADLLAEALGGWFVLGARNALRASFARMLDAWGLKDHVRDATSHQAMKRGFQAAGVNTDRFLYGSPDSASLLYLLSQLGTRLRLLVGHSKGSLSLENALQGWLASCRRTGAPLNANLCIVTLGAVIQFPSAFRNVHQFLGRIDYFGMLNSRPCLECVFVPQAWHSLNSALLGYLSVRDALQSLNAVSPAAPARSRSR